MKNLRFLCQIAIAAAGLAFVTPSEAQAACYAQFQNNVASIQACEYSSGGSGYLEIRNFQAPNRICYEVFFKSGRSQKGCFASNESTPSCFSCARRNDGVQSVILYRS